MKQPSFADPLDYTRIHLALLLHMYMRRYESFALECAAVDECGDLGTSKSLEELSTKILTSPLAKLCDAVRCRAMPCDVEAGNAQLQVLAPKALAREPLGSTWLHLAPLGSTWLRPVSVSFPYHLSIKELRSSMARFDMEQRYLHGLRFKHGMVYGALLSFQFSLEVDFNFDLFDSSDPVSGTTATFGAPYYGERVEPAVYISKIK